MSEPWVERREIGPAVLYLGDCLDVLPALAPRSVPCLVMDPPYAFAGGISNGTRTQISDQAFRYWWRAVCQAGRPCLTDDGEGWCWTDIASWSAMAAGWPRAQAASWRMSTPLYHYRQHIGLGSGLRSSVDVIGYLRGPKSTARRIPPGTPNHIESRWVYGRHRWHEAEKSVALTSRLIEWASDPGAVVADWFMGSGSTIEAALRTGRRAIGIEIDPGHYQTACERIARVWESMQ